MLNLQVVSNLSFLYASAMPSIRYLMPVVFDKLFFMSVPESSLELYTQFEILGELKVKTSSIVFDSWGIFIVI